MRAPLPAVPGPPTECFGGKTPCPSRPGLGPIPLAECTLVRSSWWLPPGCSYNFNFFVRTALSAYISGSLSPSQTAGSQGVRAGYYSCLFLA